MKILHTIPAFAPAFRWGGPIVALVDLAQEQARHGHEVTVLTTDRDVDGRLNVPVRRPVAMQGVEVWYSPVPVMAAVRGLDFSPYTGQFLRERVDRFDIVHAHTVFSWTPSISAFWALRRGVPYLLRPAGALSTMCLTKPYEKPFRAFRSRAKKWVYFKTLSRMVLDRASAIHFCTEQERKEASPLALRAPTAVVPFGVAPAPAMLEKPKPGLRDRFPLLQNRPIILYLSRLDRIKGLDLLIRGLGILHRSGYTFGFVVAGDGPEAYRHEIISLVNAQGISPFTFFLGPIFGELKQQVLSEADLFVLTSYHENFGIAVLEAMNAGLPVVISRNVAVHDEVTSCGAGTSTGLTPEEIASGLEPLLESKALRRMMGWRGRHLVRERFAWPSVIEQLNCIYEQVINIA